MLLALIFERIDLKIRLSIAPYYLFHCLDQYFNIESSYDYTFTHKSFHKLI